MFRHGGAPRSCPHHPPGWHLLQKDTQSPQGGARMWPQERVKRILVLGRNGGKGPRKGRREQSQEGQEALGEGQQ